MHYTVRVLDVEMGRNLMLDLQRRGVSFDVGYCAEGMDWELDWSLSGPLTGEDIMEELNKLDDDRIIGFINMLRGFTETADVSLSVSGIKP